MKLSIDVVLSVIILIVLGILLWRVEVCACTESFAYDKNCSTNCTQKHPKISCEKGDLKCNVANMNRAFQRADCKDCCLCHTVCDMTGHPDREGCHKRCGECV